MLPHMIRRQFIDLLAVSTALAAVGACTSGCDAPTPAQTPEPKGPSPSMRQIAMLVYPGFTALDLVGPQYAFSMLENVQVHLVWKTLDPVTSDTGITVHPTKTIADCPDQLEIVFVPGGTTGTLALMSDGVVLDFLAARAATANYVTSVCTGSLVLGAAGLLQGYKAATHWTAMEFLPSFGAIPTKTRVCVDRNRVTGGGVTAGIDFALTLVSIMMDRPTAEAIQLGLEYNPAPPFNAGSPDNAPPEILALVKGRIAPAQTRRAEAIDRAAAQLG